MTVSGRPPFPKKKVAILLGYSGKKYHGMQMNPGFSTIESELFQALAKSGLILESNISCPQKIDWMRACRTDRGVHAAGQVVSMKMLLKGATKSASSAEQVDWDDREVVREINGHLPPDIRVYKIGKMMSGFDSWGHCDSRFYEYLIPTFMLKRFTEIELEHIREQLANCEKYKEKSEKEKTKEDQKSSDDDEEDSSSKVYENKNIGNFSGIGQAELEKLKFALSLFKGTHSFHNFTLGKTAKDKGVSRYIKFFEVRDGPFIHNKLEWLSLRVHGQSFMLHQIRKMIGLAVLCVKFDLPNDSITKIFEQCFSKENRFNIPKVPGEGLFLERAVFEGYNKKSEKCDAATIEWNEVELEKCKQDLIYPDIFNAGNSNCFSNWLEGILNHAYDMTFLSEFISINK
jgi:tRNA pseudouridine38-40 synthase